MDSVPRLHGRVRKVSDDLFGGAGLALTAGVVETPSFLFALELMNTTHMMSLQPAALIQKYVDRACSRIPVELFDRDAQLRHHHPPGRVAHALGAGLHHVLRETAGVAPDVVGSDPARAVCCLFDNQWLLKIGDTGPCRYALRPFPQPRPFSP